MTESITLAHISDVHLGPLGGFRPRYWNLKRGLGYLNWHTRRRAVHSREVADLIAADAVAARADHIAVTGDLANLGLPAEYDAALTWLEALGPPERVSVVPGNHDIYTARLHGASCLDTWQRHMTPDAFGAGIIKTRDDGFPYVRRVGPVAIVGLNSAVPTPPFVAAGKVGDAQLKALGPVLDLLAAAQMIRVVLIHHPPLPGQAPPRRGLADAADLEKVLMQHGAELVLHGHNHRDMLAWRQWHRGAFPVIGVASGSACRPHKAEPPARYNLFRIGRSGGEVSIDWSLRGLDLNGREIIEIERRSLGAHTKGGRDARVGKLA